MKRYASMLAEGMRQRGHEVQVVSAQPWVSRLSARPFLKKWLTYVDQYLIFPVWFKRKMRSIPQQAIFVFSDQALGPWVPLVSRRMHVVHCHDFMAQQSALGKFTQNPTGWSGQKYQSYIRNGYQQASNFICVSQKTQDDLKAFHPSACAEVVYNGLNMKIQPIKDPASVRQVLAEKWGIPLHAGFILHVGGNQWYKNRVGVVGIYNEWRKSSFSKLPLVLVGKAPSPQLVEAIRQSPFSMDIHCIVSAPDELVHLAYGCASLFLFPSIMEGFGWPIAEAMAAGAPVLTTGLPPMNEVGGDAAYYIPQMPENRADSVPWAKQASDTIEHILNLPQCDLDKLRERGFKNIERFSMSRMMDGIESVYYRIAAQGSLCEPAGEPQKTD